MIKLGRKVKDEVTGLVGVATGRAVYLNGCIQVYIEPKMNKDGKVEGKWIDEVQVVDIGPGLSSKLIAKIKASQVKDPAGPRANAPKRE